MQTAVANDDFDLTAYLEQWHEDVKQEIYTNLSNALRKSIWFGSRN